MNTSSVSPLDGLGIGITSPVVEYITYLAR